MLKLRRIHFQLPQFNSVRFGDEVRRIRKLACKLCLFQCIYLLSSMVYRSWDLPQLGGSATTTSPPCPLWGSVRLTYTICAFLSNVLQIGMRNMLGMVILHMVKMRPEDAQLLQQEHLKNLTIIAECGHSVLPQSEFGGGASVLMQYKVSHLGIYLIIIAALFAEG